MVRVPSDAEAPGGEVIWLWDPGLDPEVAGPIAVELTELDDLATETLARLGQVAVVGTVYRKRRDLDGLTVELRDPATSRTIVVEIDDVGAADDVRLGVGARVTAIGHLICRKCGLLITRAELFPPIAVAP
jgi:hypothetical protein